MQIQNKVKEYKTMSVEEFLALTPNTLKADKRDVKKLKNAIRKNGFSFPAILWNEFIIDGAGRQISVKEMVAEGDTFTEIPVVYVEAKDIKEAKLKALKALEVSSQFGDITKDSFMAYTEDLEVDFDSFEIKGIDSDMMIEPEEKDDEVPETPTEPKSKLGDIYLLGKHKVLCGDSTQLEAVMGLCGDIKVDMYLSDPPYNVAYEGKTKEAMTIQNDSMSDEKFREFLRDAFTGADAVMKAGAVFYIWHADSEGYNFRGACHDINWKVRQCLIWNKNSMVMGRQDYHWKHEPCLYGWKEGASHLWNSDRTQTTVLNFERPSRNGEHPTMKPIELIAYQITNNTKGDDIVFDNFLGSGSTLIASEKTGRICYGMELDPKYVDVIVQRYVDYVDNPTVIKNGVDETHLWQKKQTT